MRVRREVLIGLVLALVTIGVYWPVRHYGYVDYDDNIFITDNPQINHGLSWQSFKWALTNPVIANWHPVTTLSHMLDCELFGMNAGPQHLVNVLLHAANAVLLFLLLRRTTGAVWRSALVAALFAWHPLRVESVAWIAERKDVLSGLFFMLTLLAYAAYCGPSPIETPPAQSGAASRSRLRVRLWYVLALFWFALGLMSKPMVVTLPFVLLLLDYWPLRRLSLPAGQFRFPGLRRLLVEKLPFLGLAVAASVVTFLLQEQSGAVGSGSTIGWGIRLSNAVVSYLRYLWKLVWPTHLAPIYPHPANFYVRSWDWPEWQIVLIALLLVAVSALCVCQLRARPWLAVGWFWFLGMMVPVIGLVQVGEQAMADRYTYLPLIGPVLSLIWLCGAGRAEGGEPGEPAPGITHTAGRVAVPCLALLACLALTHRQVQYWENTVTLFEHTVAVTADNTSAEFSLGVGLEKQGHISEAMVHYRAALLINPVNQEAHYNLAQLLRKQGRYEQAAQHYAAVLQRNPNSELTHLNLANTLTRMGRNREAVGEYEAALRLDPQSLEALNNLAWLLATCPQDQVRDGARAVALAERGCELTAGKQTFMLGTAAAAYASAGRFPEAVSAAEKACALAAEDREDALLAKNRELLELYRAGKAYRENERPVDEVQR